MNLRANEHHLASIRNIHYSPYIRAVKWKAVIARNKTLRLPETLGAMARRAAELAPYIDGLPVEGARIAVT